MRILDVGANDGWWYKNTLNTYPQAEFILVEANPYNEPALQQLGVEYHIACLSDEVKQVDFFITADNPTSTGASYYLENTDNFHQDNTRSIELTTTTLDILFPSETFDYIKMDVQGAEVDIIKGGKVLLSKASQVLLEVPIEGIEYNLGAPTRADYFKVMAEVGFTNYVVVENINNLQEDILFTK
jgi:FkbM family methyltransferase